LTIYPELLKRTKDNRLNPLELESVLSASANGYPFPTNLDRDQPVGGLIPQSQLQLVYSLLSNQRNLDDARTALLELDQKKQSN